MSNVDKGGTDSLVNLGQLGSHRCTELSVQVGQRLVKQEHAGVTNDRTTQCNTLLLTTGQSLRTTVQKVGDVEDTGSFLNAALDLLLGSLAELQTECHVIKHGHVRIQSVVLEHHRDIAILGSYVVNQLVADEQLALGDLFKTCDHTKGGGLTAAGRADENQELFVLDLQAEVGNGGNAARVFLVDMLQGKACHVCILLHNIHYILISRQAAECRLPTFS